MIFPGQSWYVHLLRELHCRILLGCCSIARPSWQSVNCSPRAESQNVFQSGLESQVEDSFPLSNASKAKENIPHLPTVFRDGVLGRAFQPSTIQSSVFSLEIREGMWLWITLPPFSHCIHTASHTCFLGIILLPLGCRSWCHMFCKVYHSGVITRHLQVLGLGPCAAEGHWAYRCITSWREVMPIWERQVLFFQKRSFYTNRKNSASGLRWERSRMSFGRLDG